MTFHANRVQPKVSGHGLFSCTYFILQSKFHEVYFFFLNFQYKTPHQKNENHTQLMLAQAL